MTALRIKNWIPGVVRVNHPRGSVEPLMRLDMSERIVNFPQDFFDAFVIGDGEEVVLEIVDLYKGSSGQGPGSRKKLLKKLAAVKQIGQRIGHCCFLNLIKQTRVFQSDG